MGKNIPKQKKYFVDTNVLIDDPQAINILRNGAENEVFLALQTLLELSYLKKEPRVAHLVKRVLNELEKTKNSFSMNDLEILAELYPNHQDLKILQEMIRGNNTDSILVTNDVLLRRIAEVFNIKSEKYQGSLPFRSEAEQFTGFSDEEIINSFFMTPEGLPVKREKEGYKTINYQHKIWNVKPKTVFQNLAMELMTDPNILIVSLQSEAGYGKTYLALAIALYLVFEKKEYEKIYCINPMVEAGDMGYLPGDLTEKMDPYYRSITDLVVKLHKIRPAKKIFANECSRPPVFNPDYFEYLPLNFLRGRNLENAVVIIDETQNMERIKCRTALSRLAERTKCFCLGDIRQIDHPYLNEENNGMNWIVSKFKGDPIYAHMVLKGTRSRGPITDLVIRSGL